MSNAIPMYFTTAELDQLCAYIEHRDQGTDAGWYYGNKKDFEMRHARLRVAFGLPATAGESRE